MNFSKPVIKQLLSIAILLPLMLLTSCAGKAQETGHSAIVKGNITVDESLDDSGDYSGFEVSIVTYRQDMEQQVYSAVTDVAGYFEGTAEFPEKSEYVLLVSRNENRLASTVVVLADGEEITLDAKFPDFNNNHSISSPENDAYNVYQRLQRQFDRIVLHINSGQVAEQDIDNQFETWTNLFWQVREDYPGTLAASRATASALEILSGWDDEEALRRIEETADDNLLTETALSVGVFANLRLHGADEAIEYLDNLKVRTNNVDQQIQIDITMIELMYDSSRVASAKERVAQFERDYRNQLDQYENWLQSIKYDLDVLAPGLAFPSLELSGLDDAIISNDRLSGSYVMLEVVRFDSRNYQAMYPEMLNLYEQLHADNVEFVTIPAHDSQVTVTAFFSERDRKWLVANAGEYQSKNIPEKLNVGQYPVRFLIDTEGKIIKKYYDVGYENLLADLLELID